MKLNMKFIIVTGGVISGLGKGITASSIGLLLKCVGLNVAMIKIDPPTSILMLVQCHHTNTVKYLFYKMEQKPIWI